MNTSSPNPPVESDRTLNSTAIHAKSCQAHCRRIYASFSKKHTSNRLGKDHWFVSISLFADPTELLSAVAFSGGVDSTCLLHLMHRMIRETKDPILRNLGLVAIHIDHAFRSESAQDAQHCQNWAESRSIPLVTRKVRWGEPPLPELKSLAHHKEEMARLARMNLLFSVMKEKNASTILMAHHFDDQIETSVMRYRRLKDPDFTTGITPLGLAGMRPCRRWGMGLPSKNRLGFFGAEGMNHWVSRPLLDFPKVMG